MLSILISLAFIMDTDKEIDNAISRLVPKAYEAASAEESGRIREQVAQLLRANKRCIPSFCKRYVVGFRDEYELGTALSILCLMDITHAAIVQACETVLRSDRVTFHYKYDACFLIAKNAVIMKPAAIKALYNGLPDKLAVSLSCKLVTHINRLPRADRLEVLRIALDISKKIPADGLGLLGAITGSMEGGTGLYAPEKYEELYLEGLKKFTEPHHKTLLMIGLLEKDPKKYKEFEARIRKIASGDKVSRWYYEKNEEVKNWYEANKDLFEKKERGKGHQEENDMRP